VGLDPTRQQRGRAKEDLTRESNSPSQGGRNPRSKFRILLSYFHILFLALAMSFAQAQGSKESGAFGGLQLYLACPVQRPTGLLALLADTFLDMQATPISACPFTSGLKFQPTARPKL
jgi:hypothetical protein